MPDNKDKKIQDRSPSAPEIPALLQEPENESPEKRARIAVIAMALGYSQLKAKNFTNAEAFFLDAEKLMPNNPIIMQDLGLIYLQTDRPAEGLVYLTKALQFETDEESKVLGHAAAAACYIDMENWQGAIEHLEVVVSSNDSHPEDLKNLARCYLNIKDFKNAVPHLEKLFQTDKSFFTVDALALSYISLEEFGKAAPFFEKMLQFPLSLPDKTGVFVHLGVCRFNERKYDAARSAFEQALAYDPDHLNAAMYMARIFQFQGNPEKGVSIIGKHADKNPPSAQAVSLRSQLFYSMKKYNEAIKDSRTLLKITDPRESFGISLAYRTIAVCHMDNGRFKAAEQYYKKALKEDMPPHDRATIANMLSIAQYRLGKYRAAQRSEEIALGLEPDNETFLQNHMEFCRNSGDKAALMRSGFTLAHDSRRSAESLKSFTGFTLNPDPAPLLLEASIDLKLTADGKVKVIEFNDLYGSGFDGFKKAYGTMMREDIVFPWQDKLLLEIRARSHNPDMHLVRPYNRTDFDYLCQAELDKGNIHSSSLSWRALTLYKDYTHLMTPEEWQKKIYPGTILIPRDPLLTEADIKRLLEPLQDGGAKNFILKPCDDSIGRGVELVSEKDIVREVHKATSWKAPAGDYWNDHVYPSLMVQDCIRSYPVEIEDGRRFDGTMRVAFTAVVSADRTRIEQVQFHGAYWKLPSRPYDHEDGRNSIVSFPPSNLAKIANKEFAAQIPVSARVSEADSKAVYDQLRPYLKAALPAYAIDSWQMKDQIEGMLTSSADERRSLGIELATSFEMATAIEVLCGKEAADSMNELMNETTGSGAADVYYNYLTKAPIRDAKHAFAVAQRALPILGPRAAPFIKKPEMIGARVIGTMTFVINPEPFVTGVKVIT